MNLLLAPHFLLWTLLGSDRLGEFPWLDADRPWGMSQVSFLEIQLLAEVGRLQAEQPGFSQVAASDTRFIVDEAPLCGPSILHPGKGRGAARAPCAGSPQILLAK